jgi:beta-glucosidase
VNAAALNSSMNGPSAIVAEADVSNTGPRTGEEVVQLYIGLTGTSTAQPITALKGFQKISLSPGETKRVRFELKPSSIATWTDQNKFAVEPARRSVWISPDSAHGIAANGEILP